MLVKIALIIGALGALVAMLRGGRRSKARTNASDADRATTLSSTKCKVCGIYLPAGQSCDCADRN